MVTMLSPPTSALYHVVPLHYTPYLLASGTLFSQAELRQRFPAIVPRATATRRDRKLHLDQYIHLSPKPMTPLLKDKLQRGYPHVLITFSPTLLKLSNTALVRYNPKSWRHREDFQPVTEEEAKKATWEQWQKGKYPSLEVVVRDALPLVPFAISLTFSDVRQQEWLINLLSALNLPLFLPIGNWESKWGTCSEFDWEPYHQYSEQCVAASQMLSPPKLPFD